MPVQIFSIIQMSALLVPYSLTAAQGCKKEFNAIAPIATG